MSTAGPGSDLYAYVTAQFDRAIRCLGWRGSRVHAGVHQARRSMRRARAALALAAPGLGSGTRLIDRELRRIYRSLSDLRDTHAGIGALCRAREDDEATPALGRAIRVLALRRATLARNEFATDTGFAMRCGRLRVLSAGLAGLPWDEVNGSDLIRALELSRANCAEAEAGVCANGKNSRWHTWRRCVRRLAQQHAALRAIGSPLAMPRSTYAQLAARLGKTQDCALILELCGRGSPFSKTDRAELRNLFEARLATMQSRVRQIADIPEPSSDHAPVFMPIDGISDTNRDESRSVDGIGTAH